MYLTGIADEAAADLEGQIEAIRSLGWDYIDLRAVDGVNITNLPEPGFEALAERLDEAGLRVSSFCSEIANWGRRIDEPFDRDYAELRRAVPRMQRLGTRMIRIMSYRAPEGRVGEHPGEEEEILRRLRELSALAEAHDLLCIHENCETWGGQSPEHSLRLIEGIDSPAFKLVFDTGNPLATPDRRAAAPAGYQSTLDFYRQVREHVAYVHIKDGRLIDGQVHYTYPGEGEGMVREFLRELHRDGYDGGISIEPHTAVVFHDPSVKASPEERRHSFIEYGERTAALLKEAGYAP
jgi:sugar phosphate isomerase/epimerase